MRTFQMISAETESHDGRLWIGTTELWAHHSGRLSFDRCEPTAQGERLNAGWSGGWQWTRDGETVAPINLRAETDRLHLSYRVNINGGGWEDVTETVHIVRVPCRFERAQSWSGRLPCCGD
jgi:hypothetical protein